MLDKSRFRIGLPVARGPENMDSLVTTTDIAIILESLNHEVTQLPGSFNQAYSYKISKVIVALACKFGMWQ